MTLTRTERQTFDRDEVLRAADMVHLVGRMSGPGKHVNGRWTFRCPHPSHADNTPSFDISNKGGIEMFACRSQCQKYGNAIDLVMWVEGLTYPEALHSLAEMYGVSANGSWEPRTRPKPEPPRPEPKRWTPPEDIAEEVVGAEADRALALFCESRGWSVDTATTHGLTVVRGRSGAYCKDRGLRIRIPYHVGDELVFWQDRASWECDKTLRWRGPTGATPVPFGINRLELIDGFEPEERTVYVTEGATDALALLDACPHIVVLGLPGGSFPGLAKLVAEATAGLEIFAILDNDDAGRRFRQVLDEACAEHQVPVTHVHVPPEHKDLADWRKAAGEDFYEELVETMVAVLAEEVTG